MRYHAGSKSIRVSADKKKMNPQRSFVLVALSVIIAVTGGCRREVTVTQAPPSTANANLPGTQYHQDAGVTLAVPQTKFFKGSIGTRLGLQMKLTRDGDNVSGTYFYQKVGTKI